MLKSNYFLLLILFSGTVFLGCKKNVSDDKDKTLNDTSSVANNDTAVIINLDSPIANEEILLRFQPEIGKTYKVESAGNYTINEAQDSAKMTLKSNKYAKVTLRILNRENNDYKMEFLLTDAGETIKSDTSTIVYKYGQPFSDPNADMGRKVEDCLVNSPLTITMNTSGEGIDVQGYDAIIKKVKAIIGQDIPDQYVAAQIGTPTDNLENYFITYPDTAVKIGESWDFTAGSQLQGVPIKLKNTYTLADRRDGVAYINFNTVIEIDKSQIPAELLSQMANIKFSAYIKGTGEVEEKTGWPIIMKITQGMSLTDAYEGHVTTSKQVSNTTVKWVR
jgi:hypothetical protein